MALRDLFETDQRRVAKLGLAASSALRVFELLRDRIVLSVPRAARALDRVDPYDRQLRILDDGLGTTS